MKHIEVSSQKSRYIILGAIIVALVALFIWYKVTPGPYDNLAQCLSNQGTKYYGAFWCPHCQKQKQLFSKSAKLLPYVECSTPDQKDQTDICKTVGIESYPTWIFADGTRETGEKTPAYLAEKTSCPLN